MYNRSHLSASERHARSRLARILHQEPFLCGSLVTMQRTCGKAGCRCTRGELHESLYLALRVGKQRKMIHIPHGLEETARRWVGAYQEADRLLQEVSGHCFAQFLKKKEQAKGARI
jgi:Family of unknown function (DUF6788)